MSAPARHPLTFFPSPAGASGALAAAQTWFAAAGLGATNPTFELHGHSRLKGNLFSSVAPGTAQVQLSPDGLNWDRVVTLTADPNNLLTFPFDLNIFGYEYARFVITDAGAGSTIRFESWLHPDGSGPDVLGGGTPSPPANPALLPTTYRSAFNGIVFNDVGVGGTILQLANPAASGRVLRVTLQLLTKPSVTVQWKVLKQSSLSTGGTRSTPTPVPLDSANPATVGVVSLYTDNQAAFAAGASLGNVWDVSANGGDTFIDEPGDVTGLCQPIVLRAGQSIAWTSNVNLTFAGALQWSDTAT